MVMEKSEAKEAVKEAITEWMNEKFLTFGKWSMMGIFSMAFAVIVYVFMFTTGWIPALHK